MPPAAFAAAAAGRDSSRAPPRLLRGWLLAYNVAQCVVWSLVLARSCVALFTAGPSAVFPAVVGLLAAAQLATAAETAHAVLGLVRSPIAPNVVQFAGRTHCLLLLLALPAALQPRPAAAALALTWASADAVRYAFLAASLSRPQPPFALLWLRYSAFIVQYPVGALSEWLLLLAARPAARAGLWSVRLPNALNAAFPYDWFLDLVLGLYPVLFAFQYAHVLKQRRAKLGQAGRPKAA